jgi:ER membrane protein complex subunit 2
MSIDLVHPPPSPSPEVSLRISELAPQIIKNTARTSLPWPLSLISGDSTSDTWASLETLYMQCLRTGDDESARQILDRFVARYGETNERVMAYQGMWEESKAQNEEDLRKVFELYGKILTNDPANIVSSQLQSSLANVDSQSTKDESRCSSQWIGFPMPLHS